MDIQSILQSTLQVFTDPATELILSLSSEGQCRFSFERKGRKIAGSARVTESGGGIQIKSGSGKSNWMGIEQFLAGPHMADLDALAITQSRIYNLADGVNAWVAGPAALNGGLPERSDAILKRQVEYGGSRSGVTSIVILEGAAGTGKTTLCSRLASENARAWIAREPGWRRNILLVVSSKGRKLSRLNDAMAATLQDLRSSLHYREVPVLIRYGLLTLVIDGFDELVDQNGYLEAWSSLAELIDGVMGGGVIVLASRDTFFSEQDFVERARSNDSIVNRKGELQFDFVRLLPWTWFEARQLLEKTQISEASPLYLTVKEFYQDESMIVLLRPYFLREIARRLQSLDEGLRNSNLLTMVVESFVHRESELLGVGSVCPADGERVIWECLGDVACEMMAQEREAIELEVVQLFLEWSMENHGVSDDQRRQVSKRAGMVAFLEVVGNKRLRGFSHTIIRDYFFSERLVSLLEEFDGAIDSSVDLRRMFALSVYGPDLAELIAIVAESRSPDTFPLVTLSMLLDYARGAYSSTDSAALNAVTACYSILVGLLASAGRLTDGFELRAQSVQAGSLALNGLRLPLLSFEYCHIAVLDIRDSMAEELRVDGNSTIHLLRVSDLTRIGIAFHSVPNRIEYYSGGQIKICYNKKEIGEILESLVVGREGGEADLLPAELLMESLCRRWLRQFYLKPDAIQEEPLFSSPLWPALRIVLERHDRITSKDYLQSSGTGGELLHLRGARQLLERSHADHAEERKIRSIWLDIGQIRQE